MPKKTISSSKRARCQLREKFKSIDDMNKFFKWKEHITQERILLEAKLILLEN